MSTRCTSPMRSHAGPTVLTAYLPVPGRAAGAAGRTGAPWAKAGAGRPAALHPDLPDRLRRIELARHGHVMRIPPPGTPRGASAPGTSPAVGPGRAGTWRSGGLLGLRGGSRWARWRASGWPTERAAHDLALDAGRASASPAAWAAPAAPAGVIAARAVDIDIERHRCQLSQVCSARCDPASSTIAPVTLPGSGKAWKTSPTTLRPASRAALRRPAQRVAIAQQHRRGAVMPLPAQRVKSGPCRGSVMRLSIHVPCGSKDTCEAVFGRWDFLRPISPLRGEQACRRDRSVQPDRSPANRCRLLEKNRRVLVIASGLLGRKGGMIASHGRR